MHLFFLSSNVEFWLQGKKKHSGCSLNSTRTGTTALLANHKMNERRQVLNGGKGRARVRKSEVDSALLDGNGEKRARSVSFTLIFN